MTLKEIDDRIVWLNRKLKMYDLKADGLEMEWDETRITNFILKYEKQLERLQRVRRLLRLDLTAK